MAKVFADFSGQFRRIAQVNEGSRVQAGTKIGEIFHAGVRDDQFTDFGGEIGTLVDTGTDLEVGDTVAEISPVGAFEELQPSGFVTPTAAAKKAVRKIAGAKKKAMPVKAKRTKKSVKKAASKKKAKKAARKASSKKPSKKGSKAIPSKKRKGSSAKKKPGKKRG